jgi:CHAD domain-containing protein
MRPLGKLRDAQVERERLTALGKEDRKALAAFRALLDKREAKFRARARKAMRKLDVADVQRRCRRVRAELEAPLVGEHISPARGEVARTAHGLLLRLYPLVRTHRVLAIRRRDIKAFHKMRLALKRLRYTAESLRPALPGLNKGRMKRFGRLQTYMGDVHDFDVLIGSIKEHCGPESSSAVWRAVHRLARQRERLFGQFVRGFRRMEKDRFWRDTAR